MIYTIQCVKFTQSQGPSYQIGAWARLGPVTIIKNAGDDAVGNTLHEMGDVTDNGMVTTAVAESATSDGLGSKPKL